VATLRQAGEGRRLQAEAAEAHLRNCQREIASLETRLSDARRKSE